jgi:predicted metal-dependent hydrolase
LADKTGKTGDVWKKRRKEMEKQQTENKATRLINDKQKKIDEELRQYEEQIKVLYNKVKGVIKKFGDKIRVEFIAQIEEFHILYHGKTAITFEQNINDKLSPLGMDVKWTAPQGLDTCVRIDGSLT